jgi:uncharacterized protein YbaP (TraB family)
MLTRVRQLFSKARDLRMGWAVTKRGRRSHLIGAAHFFPYHFRGALRHLIGEAATVLLEGPLDEQAMRKVIEAGRGEQRESLADALDAATVRRINSALGIPAPPLSSFQLYRELVLGDAPEPLAVELKGMKPWMAFLHLWNRYRTKDGWTYSMDLDAARIAAELGKDVRPLETIEEQIQALNGIPVERIVSFLANVDWENYGRTYARQYLEGDLESLMATACVFPTFCESIVDRRDPLLFERMIPFLERGSTIAFLGVLHCRGIIAMLRERGFDVTGFHRTEVR